MPASGATRQRYVACSMGTFQGLRATYRYIVAPAAGNLSKENEPLIKYLGPAA
jgi:hypothetical protein